MPRKTWHIYFALLKNALEPLKSVLIIIKLYNIFLVDIDVFEINGENGGFLLFHLKCARLFLAHNYYKVSHVIGRFLIGLEEASCPKGSCMPLS